MARKILSSSSKTVRTSIAASGFTFATVKAGALPFTGEIDPPGRCVAVTTAVARDTSVVALVHLSRVVVLGQLLGE